MAKKAKEKAVETKVAPEPVNLPTPKVDPRSLLNSRDLQAVDGAEERRLKHISRKADAGAARAAKAAENG